MVNYNIDPRHHAEQSLERANDICRTIERDQQERDPMYGIEPLPEPPFQREALMRARQPVARSMASEVSKDWADWANGLIKRALDRRDKAIAESMVEVLAEHGDQLRMQIRQEAAEAMADIVGQLHDEMRQLRDEVQSLRQKVDQLLHVPAV